MKRFTEKLALVALPKILLETLQMYFRVEVEGLHYLPKKGKALVISNHSGCSGLDAAMLGYTLYKEFHRLPRILALWTFFHWFPSLAASAKQMGLREASFQNGISLLKKNHLTVIFPEGAEGSFKPSSEKYLLRDFKTGFVRMALLSKATVIPCVIIGAEESNINLATLRLEKYLKGLPIPVPLNLIPLPAKWKIQFLPPLDLSSLSLEDAHNREKLQNFAEKVRTSMQSVINSELIKRKYVYFNYDCLSKPSLIA